MTLAEKHKIKAEEKKLEKEEARAAFRLNQIKPTTNACFNILDRKSTRLNSSHMSESRMPSSA